MIGRLITGQFQYTSPRDSGWGFMTFQGRQERRRPSRVGWYTRAPQESDMPKKGGETTINQGPAPRSTHWSDKVDTRGNARERGEDPSPDNRRRGETSVRDRDTAARKAAAK